MVEPTVKTPLISEDTVVFGLLMVILAFVFYTSNSSNRNFKRFYTIIPPLLLCYFVPGLFNSFDVIDGSNSQLYKVSSSYLLPACLVLFTLNIDFIQVWNLRKKVGLLFVAGMIGVVLGGPIAVWLFAFIAPEVVAGEVWKGLATLAGSWIGGGANQAALFRIFEPSPEIFGATVAVDVFIGYSWMAFLLYGAGKQAQFNRYLGASSEEVQQLTKQIKSKEFSQTPVVAETKDYILMLGIAFGVTGISHFLGSKIAQSIATAAPHLDRFSLTSSFFWLIFLSTLMGIALSFTPARKLEMRGASKLATVFLYILIATIGMQMDVFAIFDNPGLFLVGIVWVSVHIFILFLVARLVKAPFFFFAMGSMGNIGGVASASVTAGAFHPSLVPVGVFISVFSYAIGTYAGYLCGILMQWAAP